MWIAVNGAAIRCLRKSGRPGRAGPRFACPSKLRVNKMQALPGRRGATGTKRDGKKTA
jgi:hypothetical protein